jgi:hypothetical protein
MAELIHVKGLKELQAFLNTLAPKLEQNILGGALRAARNVLEAEAKRLLESNGSVISAQLRDSVRVSVRKRRGKVRATIKAQGDKNEAIWVEYGTAAHWITVKKEARPGRITRRGYRKVSIRTVNRMAKTGSLKIGTNFVGASVSHPGARAKPYMRPALDGKAREAVIAAAEYIKKRLVKKHGLTQAAEVEIA